MSEVKNSLRFIHVDTEDRTATNEFMNRELVPVIREMRTSINRRDGGWVAITEDYIATLDDQFIKADCTAGIVTVTLPDAASCQSRVWYFFKTDGSANQLRVVPPTGQLISGLTVVAISSSGSMTIISDGANYWMSAAI